ncbi:hypothetical protein QB898_04710 [Ottowia sp. 10c7w1]|uniref:WD40 repeat domain-containing protein n=2 Tax=Ottowia cancrivicina TaxID=3040346 RepID=A0AAW6RKG4_9BURK|nr:hypothetical protein [Ottowia sp. 10c7w1]
MPENRPPMNPVVHIPLPFAATAVAVDAHCARAALASPGGGGLHVVDLENVTAQAVPSSAQADTHPAALRWHGRWLCAAGETGARLDVWDAENGLALAHSLGMGGMAIRSMDVDPATGRAVLLLKPQAAAQGGSHAGHTGQPGCLAEVDLASGQLLDEAPLPEGMWPCVAYGSAGGICVAGVARAEHAERGKGGRQGRALALLSGSACSRLRSLEIAALPGTDMLIPAFIALAGGACVVAAASFQRQAFYVKEGGLDGGAPWQELRFADERCLALAAATRASVLALTEAGDAPGSLWLTNLLQPAQRLRLHGTPLCMDAQAGRVLVSADQSLTLLA